MYCCRDSLGASRPRTSTFWAEAPIPEPHFILSLIAHVHLFERFDGAALLPIYRVHHATSSSQSKLRLRPCTAEHGNCVTSSNSSLCRSEIQLVFRQHWNAAVSFVDVPLGRLSWDLLSTPREDGQMKLDQSIFPSFSRQQGVASAARLIAVHSLVSFLFGGCGTCFPMSSGKMTQATGSSAHRDYEVFPHDAYPLPHGICSTCV